MSSDRRCSLKSATTVDLFKVPGVHRQSAEGRRYGDLVAGFVAALGGEAALTEPQRSDVRRAAELTALGEQLRAKALRGEQVDLLALVRIEGAGDRAVRRLGIKHLEPTGPSLAEYAASRKASAA